MVALVPVPEVVALPPDTAMPPEVIRTWNWSLAATRPPDTCLFNVTQTGVGVFWQAVEVKVPAPVPVTVALTLLNKPVPLAPQLSLPVWPGLRRRTSGPTPQPCWCRAPSGWSRLVPPRF